MDKVGLLMRVVVLDSETTGVCAERDELICVALTAVEIERFGGRIVRELGSYFGQQEPQHEMSIEAEEITGLSKSLLCGQRFHLERIEALLDQCELVISHNAAFDRPFIERSLPQFARLPWACSLAEIDWFGAEGQENASLNHLFALHGWRSNGTAESDCSQLARLLAIPLPVTPWNGYTQLVDAAEAVEHQLSLPDPDASYHAALVTAGYVRDETSRRWWKRLCNERGPERELAQLTASLTGSGTHRLQWEVVDARTRFSGRSGEVHEIILKC